MADVIITGNVQTLASSGSTTPAVTITSSVAPGVTLQGSLTVGGAGPNEVSASTDTNITGILKGNGSNVLAATAGTDYYAPGSTDVAVADGGTGASTAAGALTNLGLTATATEINYTDGVTSAIQTQLNAKAVDADVVHDTGNETVAGIKTFTSDPVIPDEVYGAGWNGSLEPPTKNSVYDKIETISAGSGVTEALAIAYAVTL